MHQASDFKMRENFLSLVIHRQLIENNWNPQKYVSLSFGSNNCSSQISGLATDMSLWFIVNTGVWRKVVENIHNQPSRSLHTPQITMQIWKSQLF